MLWYLATRLTREAANDTYEPAMCMYCSFREDGWTALLQYDEVYQSAVGAETESTYGFHESWDEMREDLAG